MNRIKAEQILKQSLGNPKAKFREGQWEAIDALVNQKQKLMVVQRTGWGKSSVYFISTRFLRDNGAGPTIIVSPLLALMRNQIDYAEKLEIKAVTINSSNQDEWDQIKESILSDDIDAILISPERFSNENFIKEFFQPISERIGLFVVDEAHCISDWGHDFRPDYRRLVNILNQLPPNMPLLATTATANDRVLEDVENQLGNIKTQKGQLMRESLCLQNIVLPDQASRMAWLVQYIPRLNNSGIVYVLTTRIAEKIADWLNHKGISAGAYHSSITHDDFTNSDKYRRYLEMQLLNDNIKVLVATTALGMGYDKPNLGFVIHFQAVGSIVTYYQQVGRAGRALDKAYGVLFSGKEDEIIHEYFRRNAFPKEKHVDLILEKLEEHDGLSITELYQYVNLRKGQIEQVLKLLNVESPAPIIKDGSKWMRTPNPYELNQDRIEHLTGQKEMEWEEVQNYISSDKCLMEYLCKILDDPEPKECGRCSVCLGKPLVEIEIDQKLVNEAKRFLKHAEFPIKLKIQVPHGAFEVYDFQGNIPDTLRGSEGRILSHWKDAGWGSIVAEDKNKGHFRDELVDALTEMIELRWKPNPPPEWVTCIPSLNHPELVPNFAKRISSKLKLPFVSSIRKIRSNDPQKNQENRFHQCKNLDGAFELIDNIHDTPVILVDDIIDSGWTLTILSALLLQKGSGPVYPVVLSSTAS